ncbi:hypothetical protein LINGRAHAP2_LOCUS24372 [Linum grandiflorum]
MLSLLRRFSSCSWISMLRIIRMVMGTRARTRSRLIIMTRLSKPNYTNLLIIQGCHDRSSFCLLHPLGLCLFIIRSSYYIHHIHNIYFYIWFISPGLLLFPCFVFLGG